MATIRLTLNEYEKIMGEAIQAWNRADAEAVASFYTDDLDYRDPSAARGITDKQAFIAYLRLMFTIWPKQEWVVSEIFQHANDGAFSATYRFTIANNDTTITGNGIDLVEFRGNKICKNHVYLNADRWNSWLKKELSK